MLAIGKSERDDGRSMATAAANTNSNGPTSVTIPGADDLDPKDLKPLVFFSNPGFPHTLTSPAVGKQIVDSGGAGFGGFLLFVRVPTGATVTAVSAGGTWDAVQVAIAPTP